MSGEPFVHLVRAGRAASPRARSSCCTAAAPTSTTSCPLLDVLDPERRLLGVTPGAPLPGPARRALVVRVPRVGFPDPATFHATYARPDDVPRRAADRARPRLGAHDRRRLLDGLRHVLRVSGSGRAARRRPGILAISGFIPTVDGWEPELDSPRRPAGVRSRTAAATRSSPSSSRATPATRLEAAGLDVEYHEHGGGHKIDPRTVPLMRAWVQSRVASF